MRLSRDGPNALPSHTMGPLDVLIGQLKNPLLLLLAATAVISIFLHDATDATIILAIVVLSIGLGFFNEYRAQRAIADLHAQVHHSAHVIRSGTAQSIDTTGLVAGDVVVLGVGDIVPADVRLLDSTGLTCDEAVVTGESLPVEKSVVPVAVGGDSALASCALMGTIVRAGAGRGVVIATGSSTQLGGIAASLGKRMPETTFQKGLRQFSGLLVWITGIVLAVVFPLLAFVHHSFFESLLFALAIAVSLTPQLLPAIVTVSLATGARRMAQQKVLVKRLVSMEDLGNMTVLFTDKTGTLTAGQMTFADALDTEGRQSDAVLELATILTTSSRVEAARRAATLRARSTRRSWPRLRPRRSIAGAGKRSRKCPSITSAVAVRSSSRTEPNERSSSKGRAGIRARRVRRGSPGSLKCRAPSFPPARG